MKREKVSKTAASGVVALIFLVLGFQIAVITGNVIDFRARRGAAEMEDAAAAISPAAIALQEGGALADLEISEEPVAAAPGLSEAGRGRGADARRGTMAALVRMDTAARSFTDSRTVLEEKYGRPKVHTFDFDPNTISEDSLVLLGLSPKQAAVIGRYRQKGGRFRTKADFAKMYVVDSVFFARVEQHISIPRLDLNTADSAALVTLRGIGPYYASKILEYRRLLGGSFTSAEQLMEIEGIDAERFDGLRDAVGVRCIPAAFDIWHADSAALARHPYIGPYAARGILRYRALIDSTSWSLEDLRSAGVISEENFALMKKMELQSRK